MVVVLAIGATLVTIGVPSFVSTITRYRIMTETNSLVVDLQYARSEAIKQGITVTMCASTDGATCSGANSWATGHIVTSTPGAVGAANTGVLRVQNAFSGTDTATGVDSTSAAVNRIAFNRDGFAGTTTAWNNFASLPGNVHLTVHQAPDDATVGLCVVVSKVGQVAQIPRGVNDAFGGACS